jgi:2-oxoglutarate dehydrogenase E1 component
MPLTPDFVQRANSAYIEEQHRRFREDPASVSEDWAAFFAGFELGGARPGGPASGTSALVQRYRTLGHLCAILDPLGEPPALLAALEPASVGLTDADLDRPAPEDSLPGGFRGTVRELIAALRRTYCDTVAVETLRLEDEERREWLQERMEPVRNHPVPPPEDRVRLLRQLLLADGIEEFLHVRYPGQKRFSLEGAGALVPMLHTLIEVAASSGVEQLVLGMPHRGRLNVLANILRKPYEAVFSEFESTFLPEDIQGHGDVKYHLGYSADLLSRSGRPIHLDLNFNPSHLEFVNPVVLGAVRARQDMTGDASRSRCVPVLIHGDAAFAGEGVVPETLALPDLAHYRTGGTIHVIVNNQVGFTTSPQDARATRYCTDVAQVEDAPVFHVNADDPEAAVHVIALAMNYRARYQRDVFVDLIGYRKYGHNEMDDPTFTQPVMYRKIAEHEPVSRRYARRLVEEGVLDAAGSKAIEEEIARGFQEAHKKARGAAPVRTQVPLGGGWTGLEWAGHDWEADTAVPRDALERVLAAVTTVPDGFHLHRKIVQLHAERRAMVAEDRIDWGLGEALAFGTLLLERRHVRLSGQDSGRGTFSHRHAVLHDQEDDSTWTPLQHVAEDQGRFEAFDTPLAETAPLGFEYGYSTADPHTLVVWEAQFGDFANVGQVIIDQFIASAESKWRRMSGLVLLLPHGYEGQGPEHSSARLERFLELCANGNLQVVNLTTPAQFFHALRRQLLRRFRKPLVVMSPKSLLRHKLAVSPAAEFTAGRFHTVIDDAAVADRSAVRVVVLTSGKLAYTLAEARAAGGVKDVALVRVEQLYPFPATELRALFAAYPRARDIRWAQEEPANMGAWRNTRHRIEATLPEGATLRLVARKAAPSPATGYYPMHVQQERQLVERALSPSLPPLGVPAVEPERAARSGGKR